MNPGGVAWASTLFNHVFGAEPRERNAAESTRVLETAPTSLKFCSYF
jgi:hypothetical protein